MVRTLVHPGPPAQDRLSSVPGRISRLSLRLAKDFTVNEAVATALAEAGFESGYVRLRNVALEPLKYVIPAPSPDDAHAAWYSETHAPAGCGLVEEAGAIVGLRDGAPFIHCHGIWQLADGSRRMGHLLAHDSFLAQETQVEAWAITGALFEVRDDPETNFRLFAPAMRGDRPESSGARGFLCAVRPNEDITQTIEQACRQQGISHALVHGIGSLVGADFADGTHVASYATEVLVISGEVVPTDAGPHCRLDIALVDIEGTITEGRLAGHNSVCVTFELLIEEG